MGRARASNVTKPARLGCCGQGEQRAGLGPEHLHELLLGQRVGVLPVGRRESSGRKVSALSSWRSSGPTGHEHRAAAAACRSGEARRSRPRCGWAAAREAAGTPPRGPWPGLPPAPRWGAEGGGSGRGSPLQRSSAAGPSARRRRPRGRPDPALRRACPGRVRDGGVELPKRASADDVVHHPRRLVETPPHAGAELGQVLHAFAEQVEPARSPVRPSAPAAIGTIRPARGFSRWSAANVAEPRPARSGQGEGVGEESQRRYHRRFTIGGLAPDGGPGSPPR